MTPGDIVEKILPDRPALLYKAGQLAAEKPLEPKLSRACYERGLRILEERPDLSPDDLFIKGRLYRALGMLGEAIKAFEDAVARKTSEAQWHFELAELLVKQDRISDARKELDMALSLRPDHQAARKLEESLRLPKDPKH